MNEVAGALGSMLSLIVVTLLGFLAARLGYLTSEVRPRISSLIFNITLPCTILASVGEVDPSLGGDQVAWSFVLGGALFFVMLAAGAVACVVAGAPRMLRSLYLFTGVLTNTGFIGFAVLESIFGGGSVFLGSIFIAVSNVFLFSIGIAVLRSGGRPEPGADAPSEGARRRRTVDVRAMLRDMVNPPLVASLAAIALFFTGASLPGPVMEGVTMASGITSPLAMMLVGLSIADSDLREVLVDARLWVFTLVRFLVVPAALYALLAPVIPSELVLGIFIVMLAMPTGSMAAPIAAAYGQDAAFAARGTIVSTVASFAIVPVLLAIMSL